MNCIYWESESEETTMLSDVINLLTDGITGLGGVLLVFGLVNLGMTVKDGMQGGGGQLSGAIAMIVGGLIVMVAAGYFSTIDWGTVSGH